MDKSILWWIVGALLVFILLVLGIKLLNKDDEVVPAVVDNTPNPVTVVNPIPSETRSEETVFSIASSIGNASQFAVLLANTGVGTSIGTTTYTVFVPTDAAFNKTATGYVSGLGASAKKRLVQYHIVSGRSIDTDAIRYGTIQAVSKDYLNFSVGEDKTPRVNSSNIIKQYKAKNGIVYVIDSVLLPPLLSK
ncbi:MAG: fasciclin domain-containing protein [Nitrospira sp.]